MADNRGSPQTKRRLYKREQTLSHTQVGGSDLHPFSKAKARGQS